MAIRILKQPISRKELKEMAEEQFGDLVKAVVDIEQEIMAVGGELHADGEVVLVEQEKSRRENNWGINLYPDRSTADFVEFDSMINLKPQLGNRSRGVEDSRIRERIVKIVSKLIVE